MIAINFDFFFLAIILSRKFTSLQISIRNDVATRIQPRGNCERPDIPSDTRILRSPTFRTKPHFYQSVPRATRTKIYSLPRRIIRRVAASGYFAISYFSQHMCNSAPADKGRIFKFDTWKMGLDIYIYRRVRTKYIHAIDTSSSWFSRLCSWNEKYSFNNSIYYYD